MPQRREPEFGWRWEGPEIEILFRHGDAATEAPIPVAAVFGPEEFAPRVSVTRPLDVRLLRALLDYVERRPWLEVYGFAVAAVDPHVFRDNIVRRSPPGGAG